MSQDHISTREIFQDIEDIEREICEFRRKIPRLCMSGDLLARKKAFLLEEGIKQRRDFIKKLEGILKDRGRY